MAFFDIIKNLCLLVKPNLKIITKKILLSGIVGTVVYYLLGWLVYGLFLAENSTGEESMLFIFLGCLSFAFLLAYVYSKQAQISSSVTGFNAGIVIGILYALNWYFFVSNEFDLRKIVEEIVIGGLMTGITGGLVAYANGKIG